MLKSKIKELCEFRGITSAYQLWQRMCAYIPTASRGTAYNLYDANFKRVDLDTLDVLCRILDCEPGNLALLSYTPQRKAKGKHSSPLQPPSRA